MTPAKPSTLSASVKNSPNMPHTWFVASPTPAAAARSRRPPTRRDVAADRRSWNPSSQMSSRVVRPAVIAMGFPERVPAWYTGPVRRDVVHDVAPPAECAHRQLPPPMTLPEDGEVGGVPRTAPGRRPARPGNRSSPRRRQAPRRARRSTRATLPGSPAPAARSSCSRRWARRSPPRSGRRTGRTPRGHRRRR